MNKYKEAFACSGQGRAAQNLKAPPTLTRGPRTLKPQQKDIRNKKHHTNAAPCSSLITEKRGRPRPKGGNNIAFNYECCNYIVIAASLLAGSPQYTLVSGPDGPLTRRYAPTTGKPLSGPLRPRTEAISWLKAGMA